MQHEVTETGSDALGAVLLALAAIDRAAAARVEAGSVVIDAVASVYTGPRLRVLEMASTVHAIYDVNANLVSAADVER